MRVVAYLRVSTVGQIDAWGLDRQEAAIKEYAKRAGHRVVAWERDEGVSGTLDAVDRPGLSRAIARVGHGADAVLIADLDRLARKLTVQEAALAVIWKAGGTVLTATSGEVHAEDPDDPSRNLIRQVMGAVIEYEKSIAVKRMRDGMRVKAATGRKATGSYPFGYRGEGAGKARDAGPDDAEQSALKTILSLRGQGSSYREIVAALEAAEYPTKRGHDRWLPMTVKRIYDREIERRKQRAAPPHRVEES